MSAGYQYKIKHIIEALEKSRGMIFVAAELLGCSPKTISLRADKEPSVAAVIEKYRGMRSDAAVLKLEEAIKKGEPWAIQFQLKLQGKNHGYTERQEISMEGVNLVVKWDGDA